MGKTGCVLGAGEDENGCRQGQTDAKSRCLNQCEHHNHTTHVKRKPAETQCFCRFCGRGRRTRTLGTRFWSGCGRAHQGARKGRCYLVPAASHKTGGAGLVLRGNFAVAVAVKLPQIQSGSPPGSAGCPQRTAVSFPPGPRPASQKTPGWRR